MVRITAPPPADGGRLDRERLRVAALGGDPGRGHGRAEWEAHYYP
jgi:hypothetical protein